MKNSSFILLLSFLLLNFYSPAQKVTNAQDSLVGFDAAAVNAFMLQNNLSSSEQNSYMARKKRDYINSKYDLSAPSTQATPTNNNNQTMAGNIDFEAGNLSGWTITNVKNVSSIPITTCCTGSTTPVALLNSSFDPNFGFSLASPFGGNYIARLNTCSLVGQEYTQIENTINVSAATNYLKIAARYVLETAYHTCDGQPFVSIKVTDAANTFTVFNKFIQANESVLSGTCSGGNFSNPVIGTGSYYPGNYFRNNSWDVFCIDLSPYIGNTIKIELIASECSFAGHNGYAYFDVLSGNYSPSTNTISINNTTYSITSQPFNIGICTTNSATVVAPSSATSYTWTGPVINGSNASSVQINQAGAYSLTAFMPFNSGCTSLPNTCLVQFTVGSIPNINVSVSPTLVCGNNPITFSMSGASSYSISSTYSYTSYSTASSLTILPPYSSIYSITGYSNNGCSATNTLAVSVNPSPTITVSGNSLCINTQGTLTASGADTYTWTQNSTTLAVGNQFVLTPTAAAFYTVVGTNTTTGCSKVYTFWAPVANPSVGVTPSVNICIGNNTVLTASAATNYTWNPGNVSSNSIAVAPTVTTVYTVSAYNNCGFVSSTTTVNVITPITPTITGPSTVCPFDTYTWSVNNNYTTYLYGGVLNNYSVATISAPVYASTPPYLSVTTVDSYGCVSGSTLNITILPSPTITLNNQPSFYTSICAGGSVALVAGGGVTYTWSNSSNSPTIVVSPTINTAYSFTATGANGCTKVMNTSIYVNGANPTITPLAASYSACSSGVFSLGQNTSQCCLLTYSIDNQQIATPNNVNISTSGVHTLYVQNSCGVVQATFNLVVSPSPTILSTSIIDTACIGSVHIATINALLADNYYMNGAITASFFPSTNSVIPFTVNNTGAINVWVYNNNGCFAGYYYDAIVGLTTPFVSIAASTNTFCSGSPVTLTATSAAGNYTWSTSSNSNIITVNPTVSTTYSCSSTGTNGCVGKAIKTLTPRATATLNISSSQTICMGSSITLTATGAASYSWNTSSTNSSIVVSPTVNSVYSVIGYSLNNPCPSSAISTSVTLIPQPTVGLTQPVYTVCTNGSVVFTATGAVSYFYPAFNLSTPTVQFNFAAVTNTYMVVGTGPNGCTNTAVFTMSVLPIPSLTVTNSSNIICSGETITLTASGANSYSWNTSSTSPTIVVSPSVNTTYVVWGYNNFGCSSGASLPINVNPTPSTSIVGSTNTLCGPGTVTLTASGAPNYWWSTSQSTSTIAPAVFATTVYSVIGISASSCTSAASYTVNVSTPFLVNIVGNPTICVGQSTTLTASGANTYTWVNGPVSNSFVVTPTISTTYSVNAQDAIGCPGSSSYSVTVVNSPTLSVSSNTNFVCSGGLVTLNASGASSYTWSNNTFNATTQVTALAPVNVYSVTGENLPGCNTTKTISINTIPSPTVTVSSNNNPMCVGSLATITAVGANTYSWSNSSFNYFIVTSPSMNTAYTVTGTDPNGCYDSKVITQSVSACTGISQLAETQNWLIYPNPIKDQFVVKLNSPSQHMSLEVYTTLGQLLFTQKLNAEINTVNMNAYAAGVYYIKIKEGKKEEIVKLIKE